jgi:hypothetical protein
MYEYVNLLGARNDELLMAKITARRIQKELAFSNPPTNPEHIYTAGQIRTLL